jgi:hypothetical protein
MRGKMAGACTRAFCSGGQRLAVEHVETAGRNQVAITVKMGPQKCTYSSVTQ